MFLLNGLIKMQIKKIQELEKYPEKNKNGRLTQEQVLKIVKIVIIILLIVLLIDVCHFRASYTQRIRGYN